MSETLYGYARVSTREQKEDRQIAALRDFGVEDRRIVVEKQSGKDFQRPQYKRLVNRLNPGDVLVVKSIDRLGRNYGEILDQWARLTRERKIAIVVLDMPLLDTREGRDLTGTLVADIVLQLLSYVAQTEREFLRIRQAEGIAAARAKGVRFRYPPNSTRWPSSGSTGRSAPFRRESSLASPGTPLCAGPGSCPRPKG